MEDFATSMKLYSELTQSKGSIEQEDEDIASNYSAARAQNTWTTGIGHGDDQNARDSHEVCFNLAYELIALGKLDQAEEILNRAESMTFLMICVLTLELCARSGLSGDELKAEQGIILTQLAFIKQLREPVSEEATKLYDDVQNQPYIPSLCLSLNLIEVSMLQHEQSLSIINFALNHDQILLRIIESTSLPLMHLLHQNPSSRNHARSLPILFFSPVKPINRRKLQKSRNIKNLFH